MERIAGVISNLTGLQFSNLDFGGDQAWNNALAALTTRNGSSNPLSTNPAHSQCTALQEAFIADAVPNVTGPGQPRKRGRPKGSTNKNKANSMIGANSTAAIKQLETELQAKQEQAARLQQQNQQLYDRCWILELLVSARDDQVRRLQMIKEGNADKVLLDAGFTLADFMTKPVQSMAKNIRRRILRVGHVLMQSMTTGDMQELRKTMTVVMTARKWGRLLRPDMHLISGRDVNEVAETLENLSECPESHWPGVVAQLGLQPQQLRHIWLLDQLYNHWRKKLREERAILTAKLDTLMSVKRYGAVFNDSTTRMVGMGDCQLLDRLQHSLHQERLLDLLMSEVLVNRLMTEDQLARLIVQSYPYLPDEAAILSAAAALYQPPTNNLPVLPELSMTSFHSKYKYNAGLQAATPTSVVQDLLQKPTPLSPVPDSATSVGTVAMASGTLPLGDWPMLPQSSPPSQPGTAGLQGFGKDMPNGVSCAQPLSVPQSDSVCEPEISCTPGLDLPPLPSNSLFDGPLMSELIRGLAADEPTAVA